MALLNVPRFVPSLLSSGGGHNLERDPSDLSAADRSGAYIEMIDSVNSRWMDLGVPGTEHVKERLIWLRP